MKTEMRERLNKRLKDISECETPTDVSYMIWTIGLEEAIGSRKAYRDCFVNWVESYSEGNPPKYWSSYKKPEEVSNAIWDPMFDNTDEDRIWFSSLRETLTSWIYKYSDRQDNKK